MLILSRRAEQRIRIGDDIEIVVLAIDRDHVKLGIVAPRQVPVVRTELLSELREENVRAAQAGRAVSPSTLAPALRRIGLRRPGTSAPPRQTPGDGPRRPTDLPVSAPAVPDRC